MPETSLSGRRVLIVEDEYLVADGLRQMLEDAGATVLGPAPSAGKAMQLIAAEPVIDGAVLDINLGGETSFGAADKLSERGVPFLFTTGYAQLNLPERYQHVRHCQKPISSGELTRVLAQEMFG